MNLVEADMSSFELLASACAEQEGVSEGDLEALLSLQLPTTKLGKCLNACMGENAGIVSEARNCSVFIKFHYFNCCKCFYLCW